MDDLFLKYEPFYRSGEFLQKERELFPIDISLKDKVLSEYISIVGFYTSKMENESYYDGDQIYAIQDGLNTIDELITGEEFETAMVYIVALELMIGMDVKFRHTLYDMITQGYNISDLVDVNRFFGQRDDGGFKKKK